MGRVLMVSICSRVYAMCYLLSLLVALFQLRFQRMALCSLSCNRAVMLRLAV